MSYSRHKRVRYLYCVIFPAKYFAICLTSIFMLSLSRGPLHIHMLQRNIHDTHTSHSTSINKHSVSEQTSALHPSAIFNCTPPRLTPNLTSHPAFIFLLTLLSQPLSSPHRGIHALTHLCFLNAQLRRQ